MTLKSKVLTRVTAFALAGFYAGFLTAEEPRTWTDATGAFRKQAVLERLEDGFVILKLEDGAIRRIPLAKLSSADQEYAKGASARSEAVDPFEAIPKPDSNAAPKSMPRPPAHTVQEGDANIRVVTVEGVGVDVATAKTDAYREAVRQVVGAYVDSTAIAANDQLIEDKVITLSSAFVEKSEPLKEAQDGRLVRVRLRAHVRVNKLLDALRTNEISRVEVDTESLMSQVRTKSDQAEGLEQLIRRVLPGLQSAALRATVEGKPEVRKTSGDNAEIVYGLRIQPRVEPYLAIAQKLDAAFSAAERQSGDIVSNGKSTPDGSALRSYVDRWKTGQGYGWLYLTNLFAGPEREVIEKSLDDSTGLSPILKYEPMYTFPIDLFDSEQFRSADSALVDGESIVVMLVHCSERGDRTRWKWFRLTQEESENVRESIKPSRTRAVSILKSGDGEEVARDAFVLQSVGTRDFRADGKVLFISPFFMPDRDMKLYAPSIQVQRSVELTKEKVALVDRIDAFVEASK